MTHIRQFLQKSLGVQEEETTLVLLSALLFYIVMSSYYILRPLREEMGIHGGVRQLPKLFLATLAVMALITPLFGSLVRRFPREKFIPIVYRFFAGNLIVFFVVLGRIEGESLVLAGRIFYVWISVFNLFALSLFWAFMADGFGYQRGRRLFGIIAIGGTLGAITGSGLTANLVDVIGRNNLLLFSILLLEVAVQTIKSLSGRFRLADFHAENGPGRPVAKVSGQGVLAGFSLTMSSPYLLAISAYLFLYSLGSTFLYFEQANIIDAYVLTCEARTAIFGRIDLWTNILTLCGQLLVTGRLMPRLGTGKVLALLPVAVAVGFALLGLANLGYASALTVLVIFQVVRRAMNYALVKPARETLFTLVDRNVRYKAKSFIDTFVYRGGDALGAGLFSALTAAGLGLAGVAFTAVPMALVWGAVGLYLGRRQQQLVHQAPGSRKIP